MLWQFRTENRQRGAVSIQAVGLDQSVACGIYVAQGHFADLGPGHGSDSISSRSYIHDCAAVRRGAEVVDDLRTIEYSHDLSAGQAITPRPVVAKVGGRDVRVAIRHQSKIKPNADPSAVEPEPGADIEVGTRRQGCPAAIPVRITPGHPSRSPGRVRRPNPAMKRAAIPSAIVERRPAPGIIGLPIPAAIGPKPTATVGVRPPADINDGHGRLPAPAITGNFHPASIGSQSLIKIIVAHLLRRSACVSAVHGSRVYA